jgi:hypothetical protein
VARNAFGLALLTIVAVSGCSQLDNLPFLGNKKAKEAEVRAAAMRVRTDSLRKARRAADSLAQVRFAACIDSVRAELIKPAVVIKKAKAKSKSRKAPPAPSEELIAAQAQSACSQDAHAAATTVAMDTMKKMTPKDSSVAKTTVAAANAAPATPPVDSAKAPAKPQMKDSVKVAAAMPSVDSTAVADSIQKARETEMVRETFAYSGSTRDPFNSLLNMEKSGPEVADLQLVGIYQNMRTPAASVAVFREKEGGKRHKLRAGDQLGRSRVVQIRDRDVVFIIEDFGFERQETLSLRKQEDVTP